METRNIAVQATVNIRLEAAPVSEWSLEVWSTGWVHLVSVVRTRYEQHRADHEQPSGLQTALKVHL